MIWSRTAKKDVDDSLSDKIAINIYENSSQFEVNILLHESDKTKLLRLEMMLIFLWM